MRQDVRKIESGHFSRKMMLNFIRNVILIPGDSRRIQQPILEKWKTKSKKYMKYEIHHR